MPKQVRECYQIEALELEYPEPGKDSSEEKFELVALCESYQEE